MDKTHKKGYTISTSSNPLLFFFIFSILHFSTLFSLTPKVPNPWKLSALSLTKKANYFFFFLYQLSIVKKKTCLLLFFFYPSLFFYHPPSFSFKSSQGLLSPNTTWRAGPCKLPSIVDLLSMSCQRLVLVYASVDWAGYGALQEGT